MYFLFGRLRKKQYLCSQKGRMMNKKEHTKQPPTGVVRHYDGYDVDFLLRMGSDLQIMENHFSEEHLTGAFPAYFQTDYYVIQFVEQGELHAQVNLQDVDIKSPSMQLLLPEFVLHIDSASPTSHTTSISFTQEYVDRMLLPMPLSQLRQTILRHPSYDLTEEQMQTARGYFDLIHSLMKHEQTQYTNDSVRALVYSCIRFFYGVLSDSMAHEKPMSRAEELTSEFLLMAEKECLRERSVDYYADRLHLSPKYLANVVRQTSGRTVGDWLNDYILLHAKMLLSTSRMNIQQISDTLGFANPSHFGTWFRRQTGTNPTTFRQDKNR